MTALNSLTKKRRGFLNQIYNIVDNQFKKQEENFNGKEPKDIIKELENNSDYIQRIFIDGSWGTGKSYFCEALEEKINEENEKREKERKINFIKINAWETDYFSDPMKSLIGEINSHKLLNSETQKAIEEVMKNVLKAGWKFLLKLAITKFNLSNDDIEQLKSLFNGLNTSELTDYKNYKELVDKFKECLSLEKDLKVIVIDELDRCRPTYAIELLETVKHFFGVKNIIFIFLVNMEQLKSIASTSYLTEDKCSEYFEKFYDIKLSLPILEYEDFIQIEYDKYTQLETYKPNLINGGYISNEVNMFYENLFMEAFNSNCNGEKVAPRSFIKSFKKFSLILLSLSDEEKACYPLMIIFILYFIKKEFLNNKKDDTISLTLLYLRTFFEKNNSNLCETELEEYEFNRQTGDTINLKNNYSDSSFYKYLYLTLKYKTGKREYNPRNETEYLKYVVTISKEQVTGKPIYIRLKNTDVYINNICVCYKFPSFLFENFYIKKFEIQGDSYSTDILEAWAKEKYSFVLNI